MPLPNYPIQATVLALPEKDCYQRTLALLQSLTHLLSYFTKIYFYDSATYKFNSPASTSLPEEVSVNTVYVLSSDPTAASLSGFVRISSTVYPCSTKCCISSRMCFSLTRRYLSSPKCSELRAAGVSAYVVPSRFCP